MAPASNAKIEELQFRVKTDPKSRLFFPLAEELRKNGRLPEAEQVLRTGLAIHATYLSAWVSMGRILREQKKNAEAVEALTKALQLDPGNVVAARLLADAYLELGEKVEAIKKYKLVHALLPADEELEAKIAQLDRDIRGVDEQPDLAAQWAAPAPVDAPSPPEPFAVAAETVGPIVEAEPEPEAERAPAPTAESTDDVIPMAAQHEESPFEESAGYTAAAVEIEQPQGMHIDEAPLSAEVAAPVFGDDTLDVFQPAAAPPAEASDDDLTATTTMADLYVRQGLVAEARRIYEHILQKDPSDDAVRFKLAELDEAQALEVPRRRAVDVAEEDAGEEVAGFPAAQVADERFAGLPSSLVADERVAGLPGSLVAGPAAEPFTDPSATDPFDIDTATGQPGNPATASPQAGNLETQSAGAATGNPKVVVLQQWLARIQRHA